MEEIRAMSLAWEGNGCIDFETPIQPNKKK